MNILPVGDELLHVKRQTDRHDEANSRISQFYKRTWKGFVPFLKKTFFSHIEIKKLEVYLQFKHNAMNM